jgi:hypothetical protein
MMKRRRPTEGLLMMAWGGVVRSRGDAPSPGFLIIRNEKEKKGFYVTAMRLYQRPITTIRESAMANQLDPLEWTLPIQTNQRRQTTTKLFTRYNPKPPVITMFLLIDWVQLTINWALRRDRRAYPRPQNTDTDTTRGGVTM